MLSCLLFEIQLSKQLQWTKQLNFLKIPQHCQRFDPNCQKLLSDHKFVGQILGPLIILSFKVCHLSFTHIFTGLIKTESNKMKLAGEKY